MVLKQYLGLAEQIYEGVMEMLYRINMITEEDGWIVLDTDGWASEPIRLLVQSVAAVSYTHLRAHET